MQLLFIIQKGTTSLFLILKSGLSDAAVFPIVQILLEAKADVNVKEKVHRTPRLIHSVLILIILWPKYYEKVSSNIKYAVVYISQNCFCCCCAHSYKGKRMDSCSLCSNYRAHDHPQGP